MDTVEKGDEKFCRMTPDVGSHLAQLDGIRKNKTLWKRIRSGLSKLKEKSAVEDDAMVGKKKKKKNLKNLLGFNKTKKTEPVKQSEAKTILHNVQIGSKIVNVIWPGYTPIMLKNYIGMSDIDELYRMHNIQDPVTTTSHDPGQVEEEDENASVRDNDACCIEGEELLKEEEMPETTESQEYGDVKKPTACCENSDENKEGRSASLDHAESREDAAAEEAVIDKKTKKKMNLFKRMFKKSKKTGKESTKTAPEQSNDVKQSTVNPDAIEDQEPCMMGKAESGMKPKRRKTFGDIFKRK